MSRAAEVALLVALAAGCRREARAPEIAAPEIAAPKISATKISAPEPVVYPSAAELAAHAGAPKISATPRFELGRAATPDEIAALDTDVRPDGAGLPPGSGDAARGAILYRERCAGCHGATGEEGPHDVLIGSAPPQGFRLAARRRAAPPLTVGNYWPYATTVFEYLRRAMPWAAPGTLTADETYSLTAWLLARNRIIPEDKILDARSLPAIRMPAAERFFPKGGAQR